jgi:glc operon protein GlcG
MTMFTHPTTAARRLALLGAGALLCATVAAQPTPVPATPPPVPSYGAPATLEQARRILAAAEAEARKLGIPMAIAVVDTAGLLVAFVRQDNTQHGSIAVAQSKAVTATNFKRPTKVFQDAVNAGGPGNRLLSLHGASLIEGGVPILLDGKVVGGVGVSGGSPEQDGVVARAGLESLR